MFVHATDTACSGKNSLTQLSSGSDPAASRRRGGILHAPARIPLVLGCGATAADAAASDGEVDGPRHLLRDERDDDGDGWHVGDEAERQGECDQQPIEKRDAGSQAAGEVFAAIPTTRNRSARMESAVRRPPWA